MPYAIAQQQTDYINKLIQQRRKQWINENGPCKNCGSFDNLEVDHIDPSTKAIHTSHIWTREERIRIRELSKCQVLCKPCHQNKTSKENKKEVTHGTISGYYRHRCRCGLCKLAYSQYRKTIRSK